MCFPPCIVMKAVILRFIVLPTNNVRYQGWKQGMGGQQARPRNMTPISVWNNDSKRMDHAANYLTLPPANLIPWTS